MVSSSLVPFGRVPFDDHRDGRRGRATWFEVRLPSRPPIEFAVDAADVPEGLPKMFDSTLYVASGAPDLVAIRLPDGGFVRSTAPVRR
jgi:hypothetical protein